MCVKIVILHSSGKIRGLMLRHKIISHKLRKQKVFFSSLMNSTDFHNYTELNSE